MVDLKGKPNPEGPLVPHEDGSKGGGTKGSV